MPLSADVDWYELILGSRDATTGWREPSYVESVDSPIECIRISRGATFTVHGVGVYAREDSMFLSGDPVQVYDQLVTFDDRRFLVETKQKHDLLDSFLFYEYQCSELPLWTAPPTAATWKTSPNDPRERTKVWLDTYVDADHTWITMNDGVNAASWVCIFAEPPYPMVKEFRAAINPVHGLYVVADPNTTPLLDSDQTPCLYNEAVPIHIYTVDSVDVTGTALHWKMKAELRYVVETYYLGSLRAVTRERPDIIHLGGETLYHSEHVLEYVRDTS